MREQGGKVMDFTNRHRPQNLVKNRGRNAD